MNQFLLVVAVALTVGLIVFGITVLVTGDDAGLGPAEPDGRAVPLPADRPLSESDLTEIKFDMTVRGYRMAQVDAALRRASYDIGYKDELIKVLQAEVEALREGRMPEAEVLRRAREAAQAPSQAVPPDAAAMPLRDELAPAEPESAEELALTEELASADADAAEAERAEHDVSEPAGAEPAEPDVSEPVGNEPAAAEPVATDTAETESVAAETERPEPASPVEPAGRASLAGTPDAGDRRG